MTGDGSSETSCLWPTTAIQCGWKHIKMPGCKRCSYNGKAWRFLKKSKLELLYDPAILLLNIYPKKIRTVIRKDTCTPMFNAAFFSDKQSEALYWQLDKLIYSFKKRTR